MAGGEVAEWLAKQVGGEPFINHILDTFPNLKVKEIRDIQRKFSNAFKHATDRQGVQREDREIIQEFDSSVNDHVLMVGWYDYGAAKLPRPIESQVFEAWYLARYPEKVNPGADLSVVHRFFPNLPSFSKARQHSTLIDGIRKARKLGRVMNDPGTDRRPLILP
jgi:hypothetical protein